MWNWETRHETDTQRLDRNWITLIQETRVVQTGVQLLTGFLLTLPFQARFTDVVSDWMRWVYLGTVAASIGATVFLVGPVSAHRILFRRHRLAQVVHMAHLYAMVGLALLGVALTGVAILIFDVVAGGVAAAVSGVVFAAVFLIAWLVHPWHERRPPRVSSQ
ncbi:sodium:proton antiporter [Nocardia transvalensis]|nr:sodium:proton antiporter [Nocardia transvalensis]